MTDGDLIASRDSSKLSTCALRPTSWVFRTMRHRRRAPTTRASRETGSWRLPHTLPRSLNSWRTLSAVAIASPVDFTNPHKRASCHGFPGFESRVSTSSFKTVRSQNLPRRFRGVAARRRKRKACRSYFSCEEKKKKKSDDARRLFIVGCGISRFGKRRVFVRIRKDCGTFWRHVFSRAFPRQRRPTEARESALEKVLQHYDS